MATSTTVDALYRMRLVTCFDDCPRIFTVIEVASTTVFLYDYCITFAMEMSLVWGSRWSMMKYLYIIQRYMPFFDTLWLVLHHQLGYKLSDDACHLIYRASGWMFILGIIVSELILSLRAWAVWHRAKWLSIAMPLYFLFCWIPDFVFMSKFLNSMTFGHPPFPNFVGCFVTGGDRILSLCWVVLMVYEAGILVLMVIPGVAAYRFGGNSALYTTVYRDGVLYYICLFMLSTINVILINTTPPGYLNLISSLERVTHSMLTSRVLLHIRQHGGPPAWPDGLTDIHADTQVLFENIPLESQNPR